MKLFPKHTLVRIRWIDSMASNGWTYGLELRQEVAKPIPLMTTVGFILHQDKEKVVVAQTLDSENEGATGIFHIPVSVIKTIQEVE